MPLPDYDPNIFVQKYMIELPTEGRNKRVQFLPQTIKDKSRLKKIAKNDTGEKGNTISFFASIVSSCQ